MPAYDATQFDPPAPLAPVALRNPDNGAIQSDVPMLLDSGADVTLIPQTAVDVLEAVIVPDRQYELPHRFPYNLPGGPELASIL